MRKRTSYVMALKGYRIRITACECVHLVRRGNLRSRDKDGGHITHSAIAKNSNMLYVHAGSGCICMFYRTGIIADRSFTLRE